MRTEEMRREGEGGEEMNEGEEEEVKKATGGGDRCVSKWCHYALTNE